MIREIVKVKMISEIEVSRQVTEIWPDLTPEMTNATGSS